MHWSCSHLAHHRKARAPASVDGRAGLTAHMVALMPDTLCQTLPAGAVEGDRHSCRCLHLTHHRSVCAPASVGSGATRSSKSACGRALPLPSAPSAPARACELGRQPRQCMRLAHRFECAAHAAPPRSRGRALGFAVCADEACHRCRAWCRRRHASEPPHAGRSPPARERAEPAADLNPNPAGRRRWRRRRTRSRRAWASRCTHSCRAAWSAACARAWPWRPRAWRRAGGPSCRSTTGARPPPRRGAARRRRAGGRGVRRGVRQGAPGICICACGSARCCLSASRAQPARCAPAAAPPACRPSCCMRTSTPCPRGAVSSGLRAGRRRQACRSHTAQYAVHA